MLPATLSGRAICRQLNRKRKDAITLRSSSSPSNLLLTTFRKRSITENLPENHIQHLPVVSFTLETAAEKLAGDAAVKGTPGRHLQSPDDIRRQQLIEPFLMLQTNLFAEKGRYCHSRSPPTSFRITGLHPIATALPPSLDFKNFPHNRQRSGACFSSSSAAKNDVDDENSGDATNKEKPKPSPRLGTTRVPTPPSGPVEANPLTELSNTSTRSIVRKGTDAFLSVIKILLTFLFKIPGNTVYYLSHPTERRERIAGLKQAAKDEANHYWMGTKLLWGDVRTARTLVGRTLTGSALTRRERKQLLRTVTDLFRLVPFSMFLLIPFMEFALPFALRIFPNLLPSTYQDSLKAEENMKRELQSRIAMTQFFQETLEELAKEQKRKASKKKQELDDWGTSDETVDKQEDSATTLLEFLEKARNGEPVPPDIIIRYSNYFHDDMTLDNMPRMQLVNLCRYMSIPHFGSDAFLRFQLRHKIRVLREDDQRILWESIDSLTKMELREACQERGMRSTGLSKDSYKRSLQEWLDLSVNKNVPIALLIMSRTFFLSEEMFDRKVGDEEISNKSLDRLVDAISGLDKEVVNEVILDVATDQEKTSDPEIRKIKLEVLSQQNELIRLEQIDREATAKRKETADKDEPDSLLPEAMPEENEPKPTTMDASPIPQEVEHAVTEPTDTVEEPEPATTEEDYELSPEEMDAISHLVTDDPVCKERAELERLKAAMKGDSEDSEAVVSDEDTDPSFEMAEQILADPTVDNTKINLTSPEEKERTTSEEGTTEKESTEDTEAEEDPVVARLKKRLESMVDKIEVQLSDAETKIGDKLHFLDKDGDGILTKEEMTEVLQQVLKRDISLEEAMEIATEMDENHDGIFTVDELINWIDQHKLVKFVEAGRDADMDRIMESKTTTTEKPTSSGNTES